MTDGESVRGRATKKKLGAAALVVALLGSACGSSATTEETAELGGSIGDTARLAVPETSDPAQPAELTPVVPAAAVALASEQSVAQSFSFTQGISTRMDVGVGPVEFTIEDAGHGQFDGETLYTNTDLGAIVVETMKSVLGDSAAAEREAAPLIGTGLETWTTESTHIMDMTAYAQALTELDPSAAVLLGPFSSRTPISVDLDQLDLHSPQFGNIVGNGQSADPAALLEVLASVDAVVETGKVDHGDGTATVFEASIGISEFAEATGVDMTSALPADLGLDTETLAVIFDSFVVDLRLLVGEDGLVRRIETKIDMGAWMKGLASNEDFVGLIAEQDGLTEAEAAASLDAVQELDFEMVIETWQDFADYGEDFDITPPANAVDKTAEFEAMFSGLQAT